jgi:hypothetical protein
MILLEEDDVTNLMNNLVKLYSREGRCGQWPGGVFSKYLYIHTMIQDLDAY